MNNAPIYALNLVKEWLEMHNIWTLDFPFYSPNLNPIKHLWLALKKVFEFHSKLEQMGQSKKNLKCLIEACKKA